MIRSLFIAALSLATVVAAEVPLGLNTATPPHVPFHQATAPGVYGHMMTAGRPNVRPQAVRLVTPNATQVTVYGSSQPAGLTLTSEDVFGVQVGQVYRLKVEGLADLPGVAVYPSIELVDRLHPPEGQAAEFPVLIELTTEEIEAALTDRLVTKVIYVQPRHTLPVTPETSILPTADIDVTDNVVEHAVMRGRPVAVLRIGGRLPNSPDDHEFFVGGEIQYPVTD